MFNGASSYRRFLNGDDNGLVEIVEEYKDGLILFLNRYVSNLYVAEDLSVLHRGILGRTESIKKIGLYLM